MKCDDPVCNRTNHAGWRLFRYAGGWRCRDHLPPGERPRKDARRPLTEAEARRDAEGRT